MHFLTFFLFVFIVVDSIIANNNTITVSSKKHNKQIEINYEHPMTHYARHVLRI